MESPTISPSARQVESQLQQWNSTPLQGLLKDESVRQLESKGLSTSEYDVYVVRRNKLAGEEIIGPKTLHTGKYSEALLYGAAGSQVARFRSAVQALAARVEKVASLNPEEIEYNHQVALVWSEVGRFKDFIGASPVITELVAEFRTARFQFLGIDTPAETMTAVASALHLITEAERFDAALVDRVVERLEEGSVDSLAPDSARVSHE